MGGEPPGVAVPQMAITPLLSVSTTLLVKSSLVSFGLGYPPCWWKRHSRYVHRPSTLVGAALIKKYSSYCTKQKKVTRVFSPKLCSGDPKPLSDRWQTLLPSSPKLLTSTSSKIDPLGVECLSFLRQARDSGSTVAGGQNFPMPLWSQNCDSFFPRGKNYATLSKIR